MSFLNQLRGETQSPQKKFVTPLTEAHQLEQVYQQILLPKMQSTFLFLKEIVSHLNFLNKSITTYYYSPKFPELDLLTQKNYQINTDGFGGFSDFEHIKEINLTFICAAQGSFSYNLEGSKRIQEEISFLESKNIFFSWNQFIHKEDIEAVHFTIKRKIPVRFRFEADIKASKIKLMIDNHQNFNRYREDFDPIDINDELLNKIIRFILRKDNDFSPSLPEYNAPHPRQLAESSENSKLFSRISLFSKWKN